MGRDALGQWDGVGQDPGSPLAGYFDAGDGVKVWSGAGPAPIAADKAWMPKTDLTTAADLQNKFSPRTLQALQGTDVSPELWYSMGNTASDYDPAEVSRLVKMYDETGARNSGGWGSVMGNAFSSPMFRMAAIPFMGQMFGGAGNSISDLMDMNAGAGATNSWGAAAESVPAGWTQKAWDGLNNLQYGGADAGNGIPDLMDMNSVSPSDWGNSLDDLMDMNSGASATPSSSTDWSKWLNNLKSPGNAAKLAQALSSFGSTPTMSGAGSSPPSYIGSGIPGGSTQPAQAQAQPSQLSVPELTSDFQPMKIEQPSFTGFQQNNLLQDPFAIAHATWNRGR